MRRVLIAVAVFFMLVVDAQAVGQQFVYKNAALATTSVNVAFGFQARQVTIDNISATAVDVCVDWVGGTAACASDYAIGQNKSYTMTLPRGGFGSVSVVCSAAGPCNVQILAVQ